MSQPFSIIIAPVPTQLLDQAAAIELICEQIVDAGLTGARWVVFPEGAIPGLPAWFWGTLAGAGPLAGELLALAQASAVRIPSAITDRLGRAAQRARINVLIGLIERADAHEPAGYYSALLLFDAQGEPRRLRRTPLRLAARGAWGAPL